MLQSNSAGGEDNPDFKWGAKRGVGRKDNKVRFYESFTLEGIEYRLFDCAYFYVHGQSETSIGKLVTFTRHQQVRRKSRSFGFSTYRHPALLGRV